MTLRITALVAGAALVSVAVVAALVLGRKGRAMKPHHAVVENAEELRMGSPTYGRLVLDGTDFKPAGTAIESHSLVWSEDRQLLAAQEVDYSMEYPGTRVVVIDADKRLVVARSPSRTGLSNPIRFESAGLIYRHWRFAQGEQKMTLAIPR